MGILFRCGDTCLLFEKKQEHEFKASPRNSSFSVSKMKNKKKLPDFRGLIWNLEQFLWCDLPWLLRVRILF